ncbi:RDD family protein [Candidatus Woesearchaeota archaeon]|nr:RDD family protein [Candidatus Woesearchaeota archaeon]
MIDQKMVNYISQQLQGGYSIEQVRSSLLQQGYDQATVDDSISSINNQGQSAKNEVGGKKMVDMANPTYVGFWKRFLSLILDSIIIGAPANLIGYGLAFATGIASMAYLIPLASFLLIVYMDGIKGGTPGKLILKMRIVNEQGNYIGIPSAILRYIGKILSGIILGIGHLMIAWDKKKQGLHDKIASTYVVKV